MEIVVMYFGRTLPKYVLRNLEYLKSTFESQEVFFLSDNQESIEKARRTGVNTWTSPPLPGMIANYLEGTKTDSGFRNGFWIYTVGRFFVLEEFMRENNLGSVLQVEADVLLLKNFPLDLVAKIESPLAFPISQELVGIPSTIFLRDLKAAKLLREYSLECMQTGRALVDYEILGHLSTEHKTEVFVLPSVLPFEEAFNESATKNVREQMSHNLGAMGGVFDGASWGQYLTGEDPANNFGLSRRHFNQLHQAINPSVFKFKFSESSRLTAELHGKRIEIYSLHIHSKNPKYFKMKYHSKLFSEKQLNKTQLSYIVNFKPLIRTFLKPKTLSHLIVKLIKKIFS